MNALFALILITWLTTLNAATITGVPPTTREDGASFDLETELQEFRLYCGTAEGDYTDEFRFTGYTLPRTEWTAQLATGIHYCVMTTIDRRWRESLYSSPFTVDEPFPPTAPVVVCEPNADFNGDGIVNAADMAIFKRHFFKSF